MGTVRLGSFPSLNNKTFQDEVAKTVLNWIVTRFPNRFFNHLYLDTQNSVAYQYVVNETNGEWVAPSPGQKMLTPNLRMNYKQGSNNLGDVFGNFWNVNQQPGAFAIDTDLTGYKPFIYDPYGVIVASNDYSIRNTFDVSIEVQTKADQLALLNICDANLKHMYVQTIVGELGIVLPTMLMQYLRNSIFKNELDVLSKMIADSEERKAYRASILDKFTRHIYEFSNGAIKPSSEHNDENGLTRYLYKLFRQQLLTMKLDRVEPDDGSKKGGVYTGFTVSFNGWVEYANPISFITSIPAIIRGKKTDHFLITSSLKGKQGAEHIMEFKEVFKDTRRLKKINTNKWAPFYFESELMMAKKVEEFNILDDIILLEDTPSHYHIMKALLATIEDMRDFDNLFRVIIYKGDDYLRDHEYSIDHKFNIRIPACDLTTPYYIDVFVHRDKYYDLFEDIVRKLYSIGIQITTHELNWHNKHNNERESYYIYGDPAYWEYVGRRGEHYLVKSSRQEGKDRMETFVPIKPEDFSIADPQYTYYSKVEGSNTFVELDPVVLQRPVTFTVYINGPDGYTPIDPKKILLPDPEYKYYKFNKTSKKYVLVSNLKKFGPKTQYYILHDQHKAHELITYEETDY